MTQVDLGLPALGGLDLVPTTDEKQKTKDYKSDQEVRWCPGCGDYVVLNTIQSFLPTLGLKRENIVFVSGIGCSSRFPYYMNTYGMHSIHGRAPAIATGLATARPDLSVWVVTGDGDALSIGGNHLIHALRRNVNLKILLFNNRIYGLTKGQYSPTSESGKVTKSTPMGSLDTPFNPISLAVGAEASFVARALDSDRKGLTEVLTAAAQHRGSAFVEIYQNCPIFNDGAFDMLKDADESARRIIPLTPGEPIRFGPEGEFGVGRTGWAGLEVGKVSEIGEENLVVHDPTVADSSYAFALSRLSDEYLSYTPTGIFRQVNRSTYDDLARTQVEEAAKAKPADLQALLTGKDTWTVD
ncbi:2-oxoacid:ferredoxin oxidoreductase subunit beta [Saccharomonospora azurea]|uniref:2-oxoacid:ferredoxin oxidoreductase, beta subunit n=1 Tax=Saccharomonospora azurea NA-128 TaxID=882081 RepID=H8GET2_9PSEU|nr:2-oxoacid:ferredoxin oxidoreductase subunit beta [Saccharomonospora azurea]EHK86793.1 2-oxoacid:ferredoxin oxidoreductase, beta subunit [Saccharomonospora azurea SZMC 14600]EHY89993.1 2-oxoacid:ferredoxin oxidoreductase, beta subunit [Saccharomonospora azurea NA-128]